MGKMGAAPRLQFLPIRSRGLNGRSALAVFVLCGSLVAGPGFLLMEGLLLPARWKRSSNKCAPIYHAQHITGELGGRLFMPAGARTDLSGVHGLKL